VAGRIQGRQGSIQIRPLETIKEAFGRPLKSLLKSVLKAFERPF
jgi:hypothetical protein